MSHNLEGVSVTGAASDGALHSTGGVWNLTILRNIVVVPAVATANQTTAVVYGGDYCMLANITKHHVGNLGFSFGTVDRNLYVETSGFRCACVTSGGVWSVFI
jgi:hypothetical protein